LAHSLYLDIKYEVSLDICRWCHCHSYIKCGV